MAAESAKQEVARDQQARTGVWIDVRTPEEYAAGHLEGATNIPYDQIAERIAALVPDKNTEIHLYCRSGRRSGLALQALRDLGYTKVINEGAYEKLRTDRDTSGRGR
jgi:phage shock protein E